MTVLQKLYEEINLLPRHTETEYLSAAAVLVKIKLAFKEDEQQLIDTWDAARLGMIFEGGGEYGTGYPDLETYINNLKK